MCEICDLQCTEMTEKFDSMLSDYLQAHQDGELRATVGERVHDLALDHVDICSLPRGNDYISWYLAVAVERLNTLQSNGVHVMAPRSSP